MSDSMQHYIRLAQKLRDIARDIPPDSIAIEARDPISGAAEAITQLVNIIKDESSTFDGSIVADAATDDDGGHSVNPYFDPVFIDGETS